MARSEVSYTYDADLAFRAPGEAPVTATGEIGVVALDKMVNAREGDQKNKLGAEFYDIVLAVEVSDDGDGDETYVFDVEVQGAAGANAVQAGSVSAVRGVPGQYVIKLDGHTLEKLSGEADRVELALNLTVGGTTPSVSFAAWLAYGSGL